MALGNPWRLMLYPGGQIRSEAGWVAIALQNRSNKEITVHHGISVNDGNGKQIVSMQSSTLFFLLWTAHYAVEVGVLLRSAQNCLMPLSMEL